MTLEEKRQYVKTNREAVAKLKKLLMDITEELSLDEERMHKSIDSAMKSEYGAINGLINLVVAKANWPAEPGDGAMVSTNRQILADAFELDLLLLEDIKRCRGFHTFVSEDTMEIIEGVEPQYEDYSDFCRIFMEELGIETNRPTIDEVSWNRREKRAIETAKEELDTKKTQLENHKLYLKAQGVEQ